MRTTMESTVEQKNSDAYIKETKYLISKLVLNLLRKLRN